MRVCLVGLNRVSDDPRALALAQSLRIAGHEVTLLAAGAGPNDVDGLQIQRVLRNRPGGTAVRTVMGRVARRLPWRNRVTVTDHHIRVQRALEALDPQAIYPTHAAAIEVAAAAARSLGATVVTPPDWRSVPDVDAAWRVPHRPKLAPGPAGALPATHRSLPTGESFTPADGRHVGRRLAVAYHRHERSPGRYVEAALRRAGVEVVVIEGVLDWNRLPEVDAVLVVESPLPALEVQGRRREVPVVFWVHHGEHHLPLNLRLADRYDADVVLMAHSWHLAHRFSVAVERWPFAVAPEVFARGRPLPQRALDVAFVGSHVDGAGAYGRRHAMLQQVRQVVPPDRIAIVDGVSPEQVASLYADARLVLNEGGRRHRPITMRVFEALGAGAMLVTERTPGLDVTLPPAHIADLGDGDAGHVVAKLLADPARLASSADTAADFARAFHTYDHRVDELLAIIDELGHAPRPGARTAARPRPQTSLAVLVDADPEVQRIVSDVAPVLRRDLPDREIWDLDQVRGRLGPRAYEAVVLAGIPDDLDSVLGAAWRYVYAGPAARDPVVASLTGLAPDARLERMADGSVRVDLDPASYRVRRSIEG